jgi:branched-chain amino acid transport system permease protein
VTFGLLLALASVGLSLIYGTTGLSNFAHGEQVTFGVASAFAAVTAGAPLILAAVIAVIAGGAFGWLQDTFLWSQLRKLRVKPMQQMIVSIGLALMLVNLLQIWMGAERVRLSTSIEERIQFGPVSIGPQTMISMAVCVVVLAGVGFFLQRTRLGRATRAVSDNPALASATGISVNRVIRIVWIMSGSLAALGGVLLALYENTSDFSAGSRILLLMFAAVTLGGLGLNRTGFSS